MISDTTQDS